MSEFLLQAYKEAETLKFIENESQLPTKPTIGDTYFKKDLSGFWIYNGNKWGYISQSNEGTPYLDWLKTNPKEGYYWVSSDDCPTPYIDEYRTMYDDAGNECVKFLCQPNIVYYRVEDFNCNTPDYDMIIVELKHQIKDLCKMVLQKEPRYDQWIEKNIGKEYVQ